MDDRIEPEPKHRISPISHFPSSAPGQARKRSRSSRWQPASTHAMNVRILPSDGPILHLWDRNPFGSITDPGDFPSKTSKPVFSVSTPAVASLWERTSPFLRFHTRSPYGPFQEGRNLPFVNRSGPMLSPPGPKPLRFPHRNQHLLHRNASASMFPMSARRVPPLAQVAPSNRRRNARPQGRPPNLMVGRASPSSPFG
jgi:hypothetical protein